MIRPLQLFTILFSFSASAIAGTIVEIRDGDAMATVMTDGSQARLNLSATEYVVVDYAKNSIKIVSPQDKQVTLIGADDMPAGNTASSVNTSIRRLGTGQPIAGYNTEKFTYAANGKSCGVVYGSKEAYQVKGIKELFTAMKILMEKQRAVMGGFASLIDDCTLADMNVSDHVNTIGVPMRTEANGRVRSEVKSIKVDVELPADAFVVPAGYRMVSLQEQMLGMVANMATTGKRVQQYQPPAHDRGRQMQQMRQSQEMMRQYPQR